MDLNKLTEKAQEAIAAAQRLAESRKNTQLEPEHVLYALATQEGGVVPALLEKLGIQPSLLKQRLEGALNAFARAATPGQPVYASTRFRRVLEAAQQEAERLKDEFVSTEHLLLAMVDDEAGRLLRGLGVTRDKVY